MSDADRRLAHEILRSLRRIVRRVSEHSKQLSRDVGLTVPQLLCLKAIGDLVEADGDDGRGEITVVRVSDEVRLSPATVSRIVDRLVRAALVTRTRSDTDRRRVSLSLTDTGAERYRSLPIPLQERFVRRLGELPAADRERLLAALDTITEMMDAGGLDAAPMLAEGPDLDSES